MNQPTHPSPSPATSISSKSAPSGVPARAPQTIAAAPNRTMPRWAPRSHRPKTLRLPPPPVLLAPTEKPSEGAHPFDVAAIDDASLLSSVSGCPRETVLKWLSRAGSLARLARFSIDDLVEIAGISSAEAARILAACEIGRRCVVREARPTGPVHSAAEIARWFKLRIGHQFIQDIWIVGLTHDRELRGTCRVSHGDIHGTTLDASVVMDAAKKMVAKTIVLVHNHPSGDVCATPEDLTFALRVHRAGISARIKLADFIIVGPKPGYVSMAEQGILPGTL